MPQKQYFTSSGKSFWADDDLSDEELDELYDAIEPEKTQEQVIAEPEKAPSFLSKAWKAISTPLTDLPSRVARNTTEEVFKPMRQSMGEDSNITASLIGFAEGANEALGDFASDMTSPLSLALEAVTGFKGKAIKSGINKIDDLVRGRKTTPDIIEPPIASKPFDVTTDTMTTGKGPVPVPTKPRLKINRDKTYTNLDTGETLPPDALRPRSVSPDTVIEPPEIPKPTKPGKKATLTAELLGFNRAIQTAYDLSFPFRQGMGLIHTKGWWTSWGQMVKSYGSETAYKGLIQSIEARPNFQRTVNSNGKPVPSFTERSGLKLTDLSKNLGRREEIIQSTWAEKIPGVRASNRAYTAFGNKLRADTFDSLINDAMKIYESAKETGKARRGFLTETFDDPEVLNPYTNPQLAKSIAEFVNTASGRGSLGKLEPIAVQLNTALFSPRLIASRLQYMNPRNYIMTDPFKRKQYLKSIAAMTVAWQTVGQMSKLAGGEFNLTDPTNSDFGKIRIGDTRLDPGAGFLQYVTLISRLQQGGRTSSTTEKFREYGKGYGASTWVDEVVRFAKNKLSPVPGFAAKYLSAEEYQPFNLGDETTRMFVPILAQDLIELMQEDPELIPGVIPLSAIGMGSNTYDNKGQSPKLFPPKYDIQIPRK